MKFKQTSVEGLKYTYEVTIPAVLVDEEFQKHLSNYGKNLKIAGFRQGKVPPQLIETRYGVRAQELALADVMEVANAELLKKHNHKPASEAKIEVISFKRGNDFVYTYTFEALPNFEIGDFKDVDLVKFVVEVDEKVVEKRLEKIQQDHVQYGPLKHKRSTQEGDRVTIHMTTRVKGVVLKDFNNQELPVLLSADPAFVFPEVYDALKEVVEGQELTVTHPIPKGFWVNKYIGQTASSHIKVIKVEERKSTELNDAFAVALGWENLKVMRESVREHVSGEYKTLSQMLLKRRVLDILAERYTFELPTVLVEEEFNTIWKRLQDELEHARTRGDLMEDEDDTSDEEELRKEYKSIAERRVRLGLVISEIGSKNAVHLSEKEMMHILTREAMRYQGREREVMQYYRKHPAALNRLMAPALEDKVVDFLASGATVKEKPIDWRSFKKEIRGVLPTALEDDEDTQPEGQDGASKSAVKAAKTAHKKEPLPKKAQSTKAG